MYSYKGYLECATNSITLEEAEQLLEQINNEMDETDIDLCEIWEELINNILSYMEYRVRWGVMNQEERMEKDKVRTMNHDALIVSFDVLSRFIKKKHTDSTWREQLGDDRRRIGDFAMYIAFIYGINGR